MAVTLNSNFGYQANYYDPSAISRNEQAQNQAASFAQTQAQQQSVMNANSSNQSGTSTSDNRQNNSMALNALSANLPQNTSFPQNSSAIASRISEQNQARLNANGVTSAMFNQIALQNQGSANSANNTQMLTMPTTQALLNSRLNALNGTNTTFDPFASQTNVNQMLGANAVATLGSIANQNANSAYLPNVATSSALSNFTNAMQGLNGANSAQAAQNQLPSNITAQNNAINQQNAVQSAQNSQTAQNNLQNMLRQQMNMLNAGQNPYSASLA